MNHKKTIIQSLDMLGQFLGQFSNSEAKISNAVLHNDVFFNDFKQQLKFAQQQNGWFSKDNVCYALKQWSKLLQKNNLENWLAPYNIPAANKKTVAIIMAGNIPLVGFHDFLCVLLSGNKVMAKMSSEDDKLLPVLVEFLVCFYPEIREYISFSSRNMKGFDAVIATGSNASFIHFEQYFSKYPHISRKNRTSVAVLSGGETAADLMSLSNDIFDFFGRGCRSVSHLLLPESYDINKVFERIVHQGEVINNKKYGNNYDYNKAVHLMNQEKLLDNNFVLMKETKELHSPLGMIYYHFYKDLNEVHDYLEKHKETIQCSVGLNGFPFGTAQCPALDDYADQLDTMQWLNKLS